MTIETYCLARNEEKMIPYLMRHYGQFSKVILLESNSTDRTVEIAKSMGADVWSFQSKDEINDLWFLELKNNCWKESTADWVIIIDSDEFVFHPNLVKVLEETKATIFEPRLFNMYSKKFPTTNKQIYNEIKYGVEDRRKMNLFRPKEITEINYTAGCHSAKPEGNVILSDKDIKTLHMRFLSLEYVLQRNKESLRRLSELNKQMGWGFHLYHEETMCIREFERGLRDSVKVI